MTDSAHLSPVNSHNEWDPLEEVIVGSLKEATMPTGHPAVTFNVPRPASFLLGLFGGFRYPRFMVGPAEEELRGFINVLEGEGVKVRQPKPTNFSRKFSTPHWSSRGYCAACPRDGYLVIGDEIIETPMCWRTRYFESLAYKELFIEYFRRGARWTSAPKPALSDDLFNTAYRIPRPGEKIKFVTNEAEPVFDAADFVRCGSDLFCIRSNVTNELGIQWLERHLRGRYRIHRLKTTCRQPMHIDSTFMPLAPGKVLVNPDFVDIDELPDILKKWDILEAPRPDPVPGPILSLCSNWLSINVLMLDPQRVIVEASQKSMITALKGWGFVPIPVPFRNYAPFGGSFHCATLDIRRRGELRNYF